VVHTEYGTGVSARVEGLSVGGKTSTAEISDETGYLKGIYTPTFVGVVPAEEPRLVVVIVLHGAPGERTYGGNTAAPGFARVVREIAARTEWLQDAFEVAEAEPFEAVNAPSLVGCTVDEVLALSQGSPWRVDCAGLPPSARAVGQMPPPGALMRPGSRLQLAWSGGAR
jgi:hypothetical protein